jgi:hypothetical protein
MANRIAFFLILISALSSCAINKENYDPSKKYSRQQLQQDYTILKNILEKKHPSIYWYTAKDSMDQYFKNYYAAIEDSMAELEFNWKILVPLLAKIHCGHTSIGMSKAYNKWVSNKRYPSFPLFLKIWNDTMVVTANLNTKDSILKRGTIITSINGLSANEMLKVFFDYLPKDGYANNINYIRLSANFPFYHRNIFGLSKNYNVQYLDSSNTSKTITIPLYNPPKDTTKKSKPAIKTKSKKQIKKERLQSIRSMVIDTANNTAIITLNTFSTGKLRKFFRQSFKKIRKQKIKNLVLDLRSNGGGKINLFTLLTKYLSRKAFKVADSTYAVAKSLKPYTKYFSGKILNNAALFFSTRKKKDGLYHFGLWERKLYNPKKNNHFDGDVYVLTNGPTFSASTLLCNIVKGQKGITLVGEETGGGWHGNNGIIIPNIILPNTHARVRLPLFRLVQYNHVEKNGTGIIPDVYVEPDYDALKKGEDKKMKIVKELIKTKQEI